MSDYLKWLKKQPEEFQKLVVNDLKNARDNFIDENYIPISLEQLKDLDKKFNN